MGEVTINSTERGHGTANDLKPLPGRARLSPDQLRDEVNIVWLRPLASLPRYVRERLETWAPFRAHSWRFGTRGVVGYAVLGPTARSDFGHFARRVFWLADHDPGKAGGPAGPYHASGCPCEAVDPLTVRPGEPGLRTDR